MDTQLINVLIGGKLQNIGISDGIITNIGFEFLPADNIIDGQGKIAIPSFVNNHTHAGMTLMRGFAEDLPLDIWLSKYIWPFEAKLTPDDVYWGTRLACSEMIRSGVTLFADMYWHWEAIANAVKDSGIRGVIAAAAFDFGDNQKFEESKKRIINLFAQKDKYSNRVIFCLGPHAIYTVSKELLLWTKDFAKEHNLYIQIHLAETQKEVEDCLNTHGVRPIEYLQNLGFLNDKVIASHVVWANCDEMDILAENGVTVVHNPVSNLKLCAGLFHLEEMLERNINVTLGTDSCASNNNMNMFEEMKIAALIAKRVEQNPEAGRADKIFELATRNGFKSYNINAGKLEEQTLADFVLLNPDHETMVPLYDLNANLVYSANPQCVDTVFCDGKIVMENGKIKDSDLIIKNVRICLEKQNS